MTAPLPDLELFLDVARLGSFARAARAHGVSRSAVSHAIRTLEERLGLRLLHRTTRSVAPTEAGATLIAELGPALATVSEALARAGERRDEPAGTLRLNMPHMATLVLARLLPGFVRACPRVRLEVATDDALVDIVREGFDAGIRFGESLAQDMVAVPFGPSQRFAVVASPEYFAAHPAPRVPADLLGHACIGIRFPSGVPYRWEFEKDGHQTAVAVEGPLLLDDFALILAATRAGLGVALLFEAQAKTDLTSGRLVRALEDWCPPFPGLHLYYPGRRQPPAALRAFVAAVRQFDGWDED